MFTKILIANRGEIAVRLIRACRELGIQTVAIYSDADRAALHVRMADEAVHIGASAPRESYLSIVRVIDAAKKSGAQAIHPGYGFLSENAEFAQAVRDAGIVFIGPSPDAIRAMGDKAKARRRVQGNHIPVIPGYADGDDDASLGRAAERIGYPVMVKAAAGGGGKGMKIVKEKGEIREMMESARREAQNAFGDARLILEKYIPNARHIEFQILADQHGSTIHLFERECSIQRRHQKIIEETPSPLLDPSPSSGQAKVMRDKMGRAAVDAARAVRYENAGTVEFIVDPGSREFYFLEMNTRLQVEHPITEATTGIDLAQWQIRIAAGEKLPSSYSRSGGTLQQRGHAIECRVYAEDPANQFLPAIGKLLKVVEPRGPGIRVDSGVTSGDEITVHYDPLIAKVIAFAETRDAAIRKMQNALRDYIILGVTTNLEFLQAVLAHPEFQAGTATTAFVEKEFGDWHSQDRDVPLPVLIAAALGEMQTRGTRSNIASAPNDPYSPWQAR